MNPFIFRKYDIRGIVETDFTPEVVFDLGRAFGTYIKRNGGSKVAISGDIRPSSPKLVKYFSKGIKECGITAIQLGIVSTPINYYSLLYLNIDGAVQITGSHNPSEYNGFKFSCKEGPFYGEQIEDLKKLIQNLDYENGVGVDQNVDIISPYYKMLIDKIKIEKPLKAVIDCGNASACIIAPRIFKQLGIDIKELYCDIDGTFPNHHPDPTEDENLIDLITEIQLGDFDFGVAYDGDADRVVVVDDLGNIIRSDILMSLFLPEVIQNSGDAILYDVKCSKALEDMILKYGGTPVMWKTGHSFIKDKMKEMNIKFAGEMSGHIFFADDYFGFDDAVYVSLRLAQLLSRTDKKLSDLINKIPKYYSTPEMRLECNSDEEKFNISKKAISYFNTYYDCNTVDGVRIKFENGWGLVRSSNTQPVIVCRFEANTLERMNEIKSLILDKLYEFGALKIGHK